MLVGVGCACNGACADCRRGMGADPAQQEPTVMDRVLGLFSQRLSIGDAGVPVWLLVAAGIWAASALFPGSSDYRATYRRRR